MKHRKKHRKRFSERKRNELQLDLGVSYADY